jgi:arylsulfatase A-like enzyme
MVDEQGRPHTAHTNNDVWLVLVDEKPPTGQSARRRPLADIAPTMLELLGIAQPAEMTGKSLIPIATGGDYLPNSYLNRKYKRSSRLWRLLKHLRPKGMR